MRLPLLLTVCLGSMAFAGETAIQTQNFDHDPQWEGVSNRIARDHYPTIEQDFGWSDTNFAGKEKGEIGGASTRSATPAYYAMPIEPATLEKPFSASGTFAITKTAGTGGVSFGWFGHEVTAGTRPMNSLLFQINGEKNGVQIHLRIITAHNRGAGATVQKAGAAKRDFAFPASDTKHHFTVSYDPTGKGTVSAQVDDLPAVKFELSDEVRKDGITADRFGIVNHLKSGHTMNLYLDDLKLGDKSFDFATDPKWESVGSHTKFEDRNLAGDHDFGYSETNNAGGEQKGEIGGTIWRRKDPRAWYADRVGSLDLTQPLHASGRVKFDVGAPDSGVYFGWFDSATATTQPQRTKDKPNQNFLGVHIEGPTRVGHYFAPEYATSQGERRRNIDAPVLQPDGKSHTFSIDYDPATHELKTTLDGQSTTLAVRDQDLKAGAHFDRFGLLSVPTGGQEVKIWFDDLKYTKVSEAG